MKMERTNFVHGSRVLEETLSLNQFSLVLYYETEYYSLKPHNITHVTCNCTLWYHQCPFSLSSKLRRCNISPSFRQTLYLNNQSEIGPLLSHSVWYLALTLRV